MTYVGVISALYILHFTKRQNFRLVQIESICKDKISVTEKLKLNLGKVENIVGKGENAGYQYFLLFPQYFERLFIWVCLKS